VSSSSGSVTPTVTTYTYVDLGDYGGYYLGSDGNRYRYDSDTGTYFIPAET